MSDFHICFDNQNEYLKYKLHHQILSINSVLEHPKYEGLEPFEPLTSMDYSVRNWTQQEIDRKNIERYEYWRMNYLRILNQE